MPLRTNFDKGTLINPYQGIQTATQNALAYMTEDAKLKALEKEAAATQAYREATLGIQQAEAKRAADKYAQELADRQANIEFAQGVLMHEGKDWSGVGNALNANPTAITDYMGFNSNDTPEMIKKKAALQAGLSDWYTAQGTPMYKSEIMQDILKERAKAGKASTPEIEASLAAAMTAEAKEREAKSKAELDKAALYSKAADEAEIKKLGFDKDITVANIRANSKGGSSAGNKKVNYTPIGVKDAGSIKTYISNQISPLGITIGEGDLDKLIAAGVADKYSEADVLAAAQKGVEAGYIDNTFNLQAAAEALKSMPKNGNTESAFSRSNGTLDLSVLDKSIAANRAAAARSTQNAANYLLDPETQRAIKGKAAVDRYIAGLNIPAANNIVSNEVAGIDKTILDPVVTSGGTSTKKDRTNAIADDNGLNKDGTLNKAALDAINKSLEGTGGTLPNVPLRPEEADNIVNLLRNKPADTGKKTDTKQLEYNPYRTSRDQAVADYNIASSNMQLSPVETGVQQVVNRAKYLGSLYGEGAARGMIGLDNVGTAIGNLFRPRNAQNSYMSAEEGFKRFDKTGDRIVDFITGQSPEQIDSRLAIIEQAKVNAAAKDLAAKMGIPYSKAWDIVNASKNYQNPLRKEYK